MKNRKREGEEFVIMRKHRTRNAEWILGDFTYRNQIQIGGKGA